MKDRISKAVAYFFALFLCVSIICFVIEGASFDVELHKKSIDRDEIKRELYLKDEVVVDDNKINQVLVKIVDYIKGNDNNMQFEFDGGQKLFNERELVHMKDVQKLFAFCNFLKIACIGFCMVLFIVLFALNNFYSFRYIARGCALFLLSMVGVVVLLGVWYLIDFNSLWTAFHKVAFTNDLWLMMPDDAIIILYNLEFFTRIVKKIIEQMAVIFGGLFICSIILTVLLPKEKGRQFGKKNSGD